MSPPSVPPQAPPPRSAASLHRVPWGRFPGIAGTLRRLRPPLPGFRGHKLRGGMPRLPSRLASFPSLGSTPACPPSLPQSRTRSPRTRTISCAVPAPRLVRWRRRYFPGSQAAWPPPHWPLAKHRPATRRHPPTSPRSCVEPAGATRPRFSSILLVDSAYFVVRTPQRPCCLYHSCICLTPSSTSSHVHPSCTRRSESSFASSVFPCRFISAMSYRTKAETNTREQASKQRQ